MRRILQKAELRCTMKVINKIDIHLDDYQITPEIVVMQCDANTRELQFSLYANKQMWQPPSTAKLYVSYRKPDGTGGFYDTLPDGTAACSIQDSSICAVLAEQVLSVPGKVPVAISIQADDKILATFAVQLNVKPNPGIAAMESEDYFCLKAAIDAAVVAAQKPVVLVEVGTREDGNFDSSHYAPEIQTIIDNRIPVACYWQEKNVVAHLTERHPNGPFSFTATSGTVEYRIVIEGSNVDCITTELAKAEDIPAKTSQLVNDSGFLTAAPVTSVNGQTGAVSIPASQPVVVTKEADGNHSVDLALDEILSAHELGNAVFVQYGELVLPLTFASETVCVFSCVNDGSVHTVTIGATSVTVTAVPLASGGGSGAGLTAEQITAIDELLRIAAYTEDASSKYAAFRQAFGLDETGGGDSGGDEPDVPVEPDAPGDVVVPEGFSLVRHITSDELTYGYGLDEQKPVYGYILANSARACYALFDIPVEYGYIYKFSFVSTAANSQIGTRFYNEVAKNHVLLNDGADIKSDTYDPGYWHENGAEITVPERINNSPIAGVRVVLRKDTSNTAVEDGMFASVTISRKAVS